jgi:hypothetical protein|tara:strand:- start:5806 stop:5925 length:120 start_codon:yes stop_codon:yes gene_type:complete
MMVISKGYIVITKYYKGMVDINTQFGYNIHLINEKGDKQ